MATAQDDDSLVEDTAAMSSYPAYRPKQIAFGVLAALLLVVMFFPWWNSEIPLNRIAPTLNGWQLFVAGTGLSQMDEALGYNWFGTFLFGLVPTIPLLGLVVVLILRISGVAVISAKILQVYAALATLGILFLFVFATLRVDAANGQYPIAYGAWLALVPSIATLVLATLWWRREKLHYPTRKWLGFGPQRAKKHDEAVSAAMFDDLVEPDDDEEISLGSETAIDENTSPGKRPRA